MLIILKYLWRNAVKVVESLVSPFLELYFVMKEEVDNGN